VIRAVGLMSKGSGGGLREGGSGCGVNKEWVWRPSAHVSHHVEVCTIRIGDARVVRANIVVGPDLRTRGKQGRVRRPKVKGRRHEKKTAATGAVSGYVDLPMCTLRRMGAGASQRAVSGERLGTKATPLVVWRRPHHLGRWAFGH
jgi:hypothetical protein